MANVVDYVKTELDTFEQRPFCTVDSLVFTFLAYIRIPKEIEAAYSWEGMPVKDLYLAENFQKYFGGLWAEKSGVELLTAMAASPRFRNIIAKGFVEKTDLDTEMQFSATTYVLPDGTNYVAFKGTDASFVGWKEDFNLSFQYPVPSQTAALAYLTEAAQRCEGKLYVGGHSKGGNLAVYSAALCDTAIQERIVGVYSHDGPGFLSEFVDAQGYLNIKGRIDKTLPQGSIIGMLLEQGEYTVIKSTGHGVMQHDPSTWTVEDCRLVPREKLARGAIYANQTLDEWIACHTFKEREEFVNALYELLSSSGASSIDSFKSNWKNSVPMTLMAFADMDPDTRAFAMDVIKQLFSIGKDTFVESLGFGEPHMKLP